MYSLVWHHTLIPIERGTRPKGTGRELLSDRSAASKARNGLTYERVPPSHAPLITQRAGISETTYSVLIGEANDLSTTLCP